MSGKWVCVPEEDPLEEEWLESARRVPLLFRERIHAVLGTDAAWKDEDRDMVRSKEHASGGCVKNESEGGALHFMGRRPSRSELSDSE